MVTDLGSKTEVMFAAVVWEADYREVLQPHRLRTCIAQHKFDFIEKVLLINNVNDRHSAAVLAQQAVKLGVIDRYLWVDELQDQACKLFGVSRRQFGRFWFWANGHLSALALPAIEGNHECLVFVADPNSPLIEPCDWITPSLRQMALDETLVCASPAWNPKGHPNDSALNEAETIVEGGVTVAGYTDINVIVNPHSIFSSPVALGSMRWWSAPIAARFPEPGFRLHDARIDAWLRSTGHRRFVFTNARFDPRPTPAGNSRYAPQTVVERMAHYRDKALLRLCFSRPWKSRRLALRPHTTHETHELARHSQVPMPLSASPLTTHNSNLADNETESC